MRSQSKRRRQSRIGLSLATAVLVCGCSSVQVIDGSAASVPADACNVTVHQTYQQAIKAGSIDELCVINGTSSGSFSHTIATAVKKHKNKACNCGATNVYLQSQTQSGGLALATVTMIAFRYKNNAPATNSGVRVIE